LEAPLYDAFAEDPYLETTLTSQLAQGNCTPTKARQTFRPGRVNTQPMARTRDPMNDVVTTNLKKFREEAGYTSEEASRLSGVNIDSLRRYENGRSSPPGDVIRKLARIYGRSMDDFYEENPPKADPVALPLFHAWARKDAMDGYAEKKYREIQEMIEKANNDVREHKKKQHAKPPSSSDKPNTPRK
jgi:transcriptional regulator with XRE-family HTH domain